MPRTRAAVVLLVAVSLIVLAACAGTDGPSSSSTAATSNPSGPTDTGVDNPLNYVAFQPPASPQCVAVGRRFALALEAEPSKGLRWQVQAPRPDATEDPVVVLAGTELVTPDHATPDPTEESPEVQRISFAAAQLGVVDITVAYVRPDGSPVPDVLPETWNITVTEDGTCPPPPPDTTLPGRS